MSMNFEEFANAFTAKFAEMSDRYQYLYMVQVNPDDLYNHYLNSFPAGCNELYRVRTEHGCCAAGWSHAQRMGSAVDGSRLSGGGESDGGVCEGSARL